MIDTHCHIIDEAFVPDREEVLRRAQAAGMQWMVQPACNAQECMLSRQAAEQHPGLVYAAYGLHPENVNAEYHQELDSICLLLQDYRPIAIGEVGMDLYWDKTFREQQKDAFRQQIVWALEYDLPLILHIRQAWEETFQVLNEFRGHENLRGIFHCFSGSREIAERIQKEYPQFLFGIGGVLTFKKATLPQVLHDAVPLDKLVLETDAPYMAPVPHRGKRNESSFIPEVIKKLAEVYDTSPDFVEKVTDSNANLVFKLKKS